MRLSLTGSPELVYEIASAVDCFYPRGLAEAREFPQIFYEIACGLAAAFGLAVAWELAALKQQLLLVHGAAPAAVDARPGALWRRSAWPDGRDSRRCSRGSSMRRPYRIGTGHHEPYGDGSWWCSGGSSMRVRDCSSLCRKVGREGLPCFRVSGFRRSSLWRRRRLRRRRRARCRLQFRVRA